MKLYIETLENILEQLNELQTVEKRHDMDGDEMPYKSRRMEDIIKNVELEIEYAEQEIFRSHYKKHIYNKSLPNEKSKTK